MNPSKIREKVPLKVKNEIKDHLKSNNPSKAYQVASDFVVPFLHDKDFDVRKYNYGHFVLATIKASK